MAIVSWLGDDDEEFNKFLATSVAATPLGNHDPKTSTGLLQENE